MATLMKPWIVRHLDAAGRQVKKGTPGARTVRERTRKWYAQYTEAGGKRRRVPLATDKAAARQMLAKLERELERGEVGLTDPFASHRKASIEAHLDAYRAHYRTKKVSAEHLKEHFRRLRIVLDFGKVRTLGDLKPEVVERFVATLAERGTGESMANHYICSVKAFSRWCFDEERSGKDVLAKLKRIENVELRRNRRALTEDELVRLVRAARERPLIEVTTVRSGRNKGERTAGPRKPETRAKAEALGWERSLIYKCLVLTGLRRGELEAVEVRHLTLDGPRPCLVLPGSSTKNGAEANLPLRADLVEDLKAWIAATGKSGSDPVLKVIKNLFMVLRADLKLAGIPYKDEHGRTVDVHALRHTTATHLSRAKVTPRVAQDFMRHADVKLTLNTYTDRSLLDEAEALAALPEMPLAGPDKAGGGKSGQ